VSAVGRCYALTQDEAARVLRAAISHSRWAGPVVGVALVTGWTVAEIAQAVRWFHPEGRS
jgi:dihydrodipicolinate synthase/N-acetylneuraminate lyase